MAKGVEGFSQTTPIALPGALLPFVWSYLKHKSLLKKLLGMSVPMLSPRDTEIKKINSTNPTPKSYLNHCNRIPHIKNPPYSDFP